MMAQIFQWAIEALVKVGLAKKQEADAEKGKALGQTMDSVERSLEIEKGIRDAQKEVDKVPETAKADDGGLNFDSFNEGGPKSEIGTKEKTT